MLVVWMKAVHIAALVIWCAGVLALPGLFARRPLLAIGPELWELQRFTRRAYRAVISPAAFVAVVSGIALIFVREVFTAWLAAKLAAVGVLTIVHIRFGYVILHLFDEGARYQRWREWLSMAIALSAMTAILWLVLAKPPFELEPLPRSLVTPGGLRELVLPLLDQSLPDTIRPIP